MQDRFKFRYVFEKDFEGKTGICYKMPVFNLDDAVRSVFENKIIEYTNFGYKLIAKNQCTGLKDKNGKLIYEGDIVDKTKVDWKYEEYTRRYVVCWDRTQWQLGLLKYQRPKAQNNRRHDRKIPFKDIVSFYDYTPIKEFAECEVIGNIYENKKLLED